MKKPPPPDWEYMKWLATYDGKDDAVLDALNPIVDKVLNYRPKDRQPKPPKPKRKGK